MGDRHDSETTLSAIEPHIRGVPRVPALTILFHADLSRVGDRALLPGLATPGRQPLSRMTPDFGPPDASGGQPLDDRHISRNAVVLEGGDDGNLRLRVSPDTLVKLDGSEPVEGTQTIPAGALEDGVVIELAGRVVLLLHWAAPAGASPGDDLGIVGCNERMAALRRSILRVADLDVPVLIRGETGSGKELVAHAVHVASHRAQGPFVTVNMGAIPTSTAASELFGHKRGAFTGAVSDHRGYFSQADAGTLFLDEIGATPPQIQPMLLRALALHEIQPLGTAAPQQIDARFITATDTDLERAIRDGSFRAALLHRLESFQLFVPPLRNRRDDIGRLLVFFLRHELTATGEIARLAVPAPGQPTWLPAALVARLARLEWPGNVRQLRNLVRQLVISSRGSERVVIDEAVIRLLDSAAKPEAAAVSSSGTAPAREVSEEELVAALRDHEFRANAAAAALGISRSAMYERIKKSDRLRTADDLSREEIQRAQQEEDGDLTAMARALEVSRRALQIRMRRLGME